ncbi:hypothetical protein [Anaerotalea alkaliphila]|uniref:Uncharacterized protein n=1 Tax=Anaerotalea alkaliphila TaxID=2662126 RepID=A0A7X5KNG7_9FIRM|nr:hypothetical protein [Anaerotalea alkaliphila]NDL68009.1 hypothetical protein [Anaerotalea alkaliphila]
MEFAFEHTTNLGPGINPAAIHLPDNSIYLFAVEDGRLLAKKWAPDPGDVPWGTPDFDAGQIATRDKSLSLYRMKNVPRVGMFGAWHQEAVMDSDKLITPERQRFAIWDALNDISNYLDGADIRLDLDNIVASASLTFKNPHQYLSGEDNTRMVPGNKIELFFSAGDSADYPMGVFCVDRVDMSVAQETVTVDCRNISGKVMKDQKVDGSYAYPKDVYAYVVEALLTNAGITDYQVQEPADPGTAWQAGMTFDPSTDYLTALTDLLTISLNWVARETMGGQIVVGSTATYQPLIDMASKYTFARGADLISRQVTRDDADVYSKVCYQSKDTTTEATLRAYTNVTHFYEWALAPHKTLYITAPDDTDLTELQDLADDLAARMAYAGTVEQFAGPFRPHLLPGDEAEIVGETETRLLGTITTVEHRMGAQGFYTSFTVDSAGVLHRPQLRDLIDKVDKRPQTGKRLY